MPELRRETLLTHDSDLGRYGDAAPPIHQTSLFTFDDYDQMLRTVRGEDDHYIYSRTLNPTVRAFERKIAELEGAEDGRAFASGMGAISAAVLSQVRAGDRVVCIRDVYADAYKLFAQWLPRFGVTSDFVDGNDAAAVIEKLDGARLLYLESPSSLVFNVQDVAVLTAAAKARGVMTMLDNSWATPLHQRPIDHGVDLVLHSASKYLAGHSDVVAGVMVGRHELIAKITERELTLLGAKLSPAEAWLVLRGLRTLEVRLERHGSSARQVAAFLESHPLVASVHFPELPSHPQHALHTRYFSGSSGLLSFEFTDEASVKPFVNGLALFRLGVSWGGHESLVYPATIGHAARSEFNSMRAFEVPRRLVRLHVGLEHPSDLLDDLEQALKGVKGGRVEA